MKGKKTTKAETPAETGGPLNLTPAEAGALARRAFGLAGFEDATPAEFDNRAAELAEAIDQADDATRHEFTRALLFAASAEWCKANNGKAVKDTAARAAACFRKADAGRERAQAAARAAGRALAAGLQTASRPRADYGTDADSGSANG